MCKAANYHDVFPDGTPIDPWFFETEMPTLNKLGKQYLLTQYGIMDDGRVHTEAFQRLIDNISAVGGGVIVIPAGTYLTGAVFFRQNVHLWLSKGATLKGSDNIADYPVTETRIEGENCLYFAALINADGLDGFVIGGDGTIDGNGLRSWQSFWQRRTWNPSCTNKDEHRARLVFISHCRNVTVSGISLQNSQFWTNHLYKCDHIKYLNCRICSPASPVRAPSTDAIDIDACHDVLIKNCYMEVNDDSVVLKGGKGPWADREPGNGKNERILVEDCTYGFCHGCLTCGSESVHNRNILVRRIRVNRAGNLLWLKMRPDTPQRYEYIRIEDVDATVISFINIKPWLQFYDLKDRKDIPMSYADQITMKNIRCTCDTFFDVVPNTEQYLLSRFSLENLEITAGNPGSSFDSVTGLTADHVNVMPFEGKRLGDEHEASLSGDKPWLN